MNHRLDDEKRTAERVGKIDLLKIGHHGYPGSNGIMYLKKIQPKYAIVTNFKKLYIPILDSILRLFRILKFIQQQMKMVLSQTLMITEISNFIQI